MVRRRFGDDSDAEMVTPPHRSGQSRRRPTAAVSAVGCRHVAPRWAVAAPAAAAGCRPLPWVGIAVMFGRFQLHHDALASRAIAQRTQSAQLYRYCTSVLLPTTSTRATTTEKPGRPHNLSVLCHHHDALPQLLYCTVPDKPTPAVRGEQRMHTIAHNRIPRTH